MTTGSDNTSDENASQPVGLDSARKNKTGLDLSSYRSKSGYQVSRLDATRMKKANLSFLRKKGNMLITKEGRNAIIDSIHDKSFSKSFLR